jgi:hypothetical protein
LEVMEQTGEIRSLEAEREGRWHASTRATERHQGVEGLQGWRGAARPQSGQQVRPEAGSASVLAVAPVAEEAEVLPAVIHDGAKGVDWGNVVRIGGQVEAKCGRSRLSASKEQDNAPK